MVRPYQILRVLIVVMSIVRPLRAAEPSTDSPGPELVTAIRYGDRATIHSLLQHGGDVNARDDRGNTPLHWATLENDLPAARLLLEHGAAVNATNRVGATPLLYAVGNRRVVRELLGHRGCQCSVRTRKHAPDRGRDLRPIRTCRAASARSRG
jgi:hypothetical protein